MLAFSVAESVMSPLVELVAEMSSTEEFLDRWRTPGAPASKVWEERFGEDAYVSLAQDVLGELFRDVNVPSKSFGELVEAKKHTPSLSAPEVKALIDEHADVVIVDARRYDEYNTMSIPTATSCPGAELVLRIAELAPRPETQVIVNCAGRTRSIIGTQSLINAGIPNKVSALRNGTIGWTLAGQALDKGETRKFKDVS
jgi:rhodanese-related sulfurtransferase